MEDQSPYLGLFAYDGADLDLHTGIFFNSKPVKRTYGTHSLNDEKGFIWGLSQRGKLPEYIAANTLPNLVFQEWREPALAYAKGLLERERRQ